MGDTFGDYLRTIGRVPLLTAQEEIHLGLIVKEWKETDGPSRSLEKRGKRAMNRIVTANLRLVVTVCLKYKRRLSQYGHDPMDLVQAGNLGLLRASEKYDPSRGYKFSTYAYWWIRQSINRHLQEHSGNMRIPPTLTNLAQKVHMAQSVSEDGTTLEELAGALGESSKRILHALTVNYRGNTVSLDQQLSSSDGSMTLLDTVSDGIGPEIEEDYTWMHDQMEILSAPEFDVIRLRYGEEKQRSYADVAKLMGRSKDQVQRLERYALIKLRKKIMPMLNPELTTWSEQAKAPKNV
ncbi:RNA polymerase sigma factor RpoD/SigA [Synechococcus sp. W4D4]|uniref:sigma-70 family RNA polymerase sigma factor n=1 Tax=Synechococcus sp. W4D4 TaxID=3392294 RepID=UPI0039E9D631